MATIAFPQTIPKTLAMTGRKGLDGVLAGGLTSNRMDLLEGVTGFGKTTLAVQFLMESVLRGGSDLYMTLSEGEDERRGVPESHGGSLHGNTVRERLPSEDRLRPDDPYAWGNA